MLLEATKKAFREGSGSGSKREVTIIKEGWGASGYYPGDVIRRDIPKVFPSGTPMYLDHPTLMEELERPERSTKDLIGTLVESPRYAGAEMVSVAGIYPHWEEFINAMADDIGLSIRAEGITESGSAGGRDGPIVESIDIGYSIDYVTEAGAGGKIGPLLESARSHKPVFSVSFAGLKESLEKGDLSEEQLKEIGSTTAVLLEKTNKQEDQMTDEERKRLTDLEESIRKLEESNKTLTGERDELKTGKERSDEALQLREAGQIVSSVVDKIEDLPDPAKARIIETALRGTLPTGSDGKLIESELREKADKALKEELVYISEASGRGKVRGNGQRTPLDESGRTDEENEKDTTALQEAFERRGMPKEAARAAAEGR